jgi:hypothetical protein
VDRLLGRIFTTGDPPLLAFRPFVSVLRASTERENNETSSLPIISLASPPYDEAKPDEGHERAPPMPHRVADANRRVRGCALQ